MYMEEIGQKSVDHVKMRKVHAASPGKSPLVDEVEHKAHEKEDSANKYTTHTEQELGVSWQNQVNQEYFNGRPQ